MRQIVFAPSFDQEFFAISLSIQERFGARAADEFEARVQRIAQTLAHAPLVGTMLHGYPTTLYAHVLAPNWVFYRFTDTEIHFLHIRDGRRDKGDQEFEEA
jgi:plasmid stabilization system protein ParE